MGDLTLDNLVYYHIPNQRKKLLILKHYGLIQGHCLGLWIPTFLFAKMASRQSQNETCALENRKHCN